LNWAKSMFGETVKYKHRIFVVPDEETKRDSK
jgi:hypothetical protein